MSFDETIATRRYLPHLEKGGKTYFTTFATWGRFVLAEALRSIPLEVIVRDHRVAYWLHCGIVMPDHVHVVFTPYEGWSVSKIMQRMKGVSAHLINEAIGRRGVFWQNESFDRILRSNEDIRRKCNTSATTRSERGL